MGVSLTVLASGSAGNATLVEIDGARLLIDCGLGPADLAGRLNSVGIGWRDLNGVLLTHRHSDHWKPATLRKLAEHRVPVFLHRDYGASAPFAELERQQLVRGFVSLRPIQIANSWHCLPFRVRHDGGPTFGFRFQSHAGEWSFAYAADLGTWDDDIVRALSDVELLALEFNHDAEMLKASDRPAWLIRRVLSEEGHLSNEQAAELLREVLRRSASRHPRQLVLLHLSQQCNTAELALAAALLAISESRVATNVHVAAQHKPSPTFQLGVSWNSECVPAA
jgi:phosphoribosyl 1,2-cyclic phosphodiesterase